MSTNEIERKESFDNQNITEELKEKINKIKAHLSVDEKIPIVTNNIRDLLRYKNSKYGDSALKPINVFSKEDSTNGLLLRLDDKLSRIKNSSELRKNDVADILGYLILVCIDNEWLTFDEFKD